MIDAPLAFLYYDEVLPLIQSVLQNDDQSTIWDFENCNYGLWFERRRQSLVTS